jgi:hypothetical protein
VPMPLSQPMTWHLVLDGAVRLGIWLRWGAVAGAVSTPVNTIRYLAVLRVLNWFALHARFDRAKDAEIRAPRTQLEVAM